MPQTPDDMRGAIIRNLPEKTGRSIDQWATLVRSRARSGSGRITHRVSLAHEDEIDGELTDWLRAAYAGAATT